MMNVLKTTKVFFFGCLIALAGCAGVNPPHYIQGDQPYKRTYYGEYADILDVVRSTMNEEGWEIVKEVDPTQYERNPLYAEGEEGHILLFTKIKKSQRFVYSTSTHLNVYVNRIFDGVEVDVRYGRVRDFHLWKMRSYKNERLVKNLLDRIEQKILLKK